MRPPGYEPGELPTAPLRDVNLPTSKGCSLKASAKVLLFYEKTKLFSFFLFFSPKIVSFCTNYFVVCNILGIFAHKISMCNYYLEVLYVYIKNKNIISGCGKTTLR